jgi:hypothetical protein
VTRAAPDSAPGPAGSRLIRVIERLAIGIASLVLAVGLIALLSGFFAGRDQAGVSGAANGPGQAYQDLGHAVLEPGQPRPAYSSNPPTSGPHIRQAVVRDGAPLSDDQLLQALQAGDIVIFYGTRRPPPALTKLVNSAAPPFTPSLAATGNAVMIAPRAGTVGLVAAAWDHLASVKAASDPLLGQFVSFWLGRGAPGQ